MLAISRRYLALGVRLAWLVIDIDKAQHRAEPPLAGVWKPAARRELVHIAEGAKQPVPPGDVAMVEVMHIDLVVNGMARQR